MNGIEIYIDEMYGKDDNSWIPVWKALRVKDTSGNDNARLEEDMAKISKELQKIDERLSDKIARTTGGL